MPSTGGASGTGGVPGTGGASSTGGAPNTGGVPSTGGLPSTGGAPSTGGVPSTGGATSTGGAPSTGGAQGTGGVISYSTTFDLTESPISENGAWNHLGQDWPFVQTSGGDAYGTEPLTVDSYAYLTGFPPDQSASATIHLSPNIDPSTQHEVEILLRWVDGPHTARGYECNLAYDGRYAEIVRWNGAFGDWAYVTPGGSGGPGALHDGDVFTAQIVGSTITTYLNGVKLVTVTDTTFATGNPGMGFFRGASATTLDEYGFAAYSATSQVR